MEITNSALEWTSEDVDLWRGFLASRTGSRLLPKLAELSPVLLEEGDTNKICLRAGKVLGFQSAIRELLALAIIQPAPVQAESAYPSPEDDSAWKDGEKTTEN